ncbi:MAG: hypothetical protein HC774_07180, partial [Sphingomonadales bacterium]|nr:hypothetical protein [Sphingomonadales bacterium]
VGLVPIGAAWFSAPRFQLKTFLFPEVLWLGAGVFGFGHLCWTTALSPERLAFFKSEPEDVAVLSYFTPMVTAALLAIVWGMPLPPGTGVALVVILVCTIILNSRRVRVEPPFLGILGALAATLLAELTAAANSSPSAAVQASLTGLTFLFGLVATFFMQRVAQQNADME